jgi:flagellar biosynthesis activator protein FlaF
MPNAAQVYGAVALKTANPRELEADLLLRAASRLQAVHDSWEGRSGDLGDALLYNRRLWSLFIASVTSAENPLPVSIRQNVANLGLFVMKKTMTMITDPRREHLGSLISINREIAAGLLGRA